MKLTPELEEGLRKVFKLTAQDTYGIAADNGRMAIQDNIARDQYLTTVKDIYTRIEALRATVFAMLEGYEEEK